MNTKVGVVVLNWNGLQDTLECIKSLRSVACKLTDVEIIVVDNGSTDGSAYQLSAIKDIHFLELKVNIGFAAGNNAGIRFAIQKKCDFVIVLNNDVCVAPDFIEKMLQLMEADLSIGIMAPKIYYYDEPDVIWYGGGKFRSPRIIGEMVKLNQKDNPANDCATPVDFAVGCCMLIRRNIIEEVGYFDEQFFAYEEDVDFSIRVRQAGYTIWYQPTAHIWHKVSRSTSGNSSMRYFLQAQSRVLFFSKHITRKKLPPVILLEAARLIRVVTTEMVSSRPLNAVGYVKGILSGFGLAKRSISKVS